MKRALRMAFRIGLPLLVASCGDIKPTGSAGAKGSGGSGAGGTPGQGGTDTPMVDASDDGSAGSTDAEVDRPIKTCEGRDGNACAVLPDAQACQRCIFSCCCDPLAACRANANCTAGIAAFDQCVARGDNAVLCLVNAIDAAGDDGKDLFTAIADCSTEECGILACEL